MPNLRELKRKLDILLKKLEEEALADGVNLLSPEFEAMVERVRNKVLSDAGINIDDFNTFETAMSVNPENIDREMLAKLIDKIDEKIDEINAKVENVSKMEGPRGPSGARGEKGDSIRGTTGKDGRDGTTGKDGKRGKDGKTITLIKAKDGKDGKDADMKEVEKMIKVATKDSADRVMKNPSLITMPAFRSMSIGLRGDIDANKIAVGNFADDETPTGTVNGSNTAFTLTNTPKSGALKVFVNGQRLKAGGEDYTLSGTTITFVTAPPTNSIILCDYRY